MEKRSSLPGRLGFKRKRDGQVNLQQNGSSRSTYSCRQQPSSNLSLPRNEESTKKLRVDKDIITDFPYLAQLLECPICFEFILPPINQCRNGHLLCTDCREEVQVCPICKEPNENIQNLAMEEIAKKLWFPCTFSAYGCRQVFSVDDKTEHEICCDFQPCSCPSTVTICTWVGTPDAFVPHLVSHFPTISTIEDDTYTFTADEVYNPGTFEWVTLLNCFQQKFLVLARKEETTGGFTFVATVYTVGSMGVARNYFYRVQLNGPNRQMKWRMHTHYLQQVSSLQQFLVLDKNIIDLFKSDNGSIRMEISIKEA